MVIDDVENFYSERDKLIWAKIISIKPYINENPSNHIVKYYKSYNDKEYYLFNYIIADKNGRNFCDYDENFLIELAHILRPEDKAYFYGKSINKNEYELIIRGYSINELLCKASISR